MNLAKLRDTGTATLRPLSLWYATLQAREQWLVSRGAVAALLLLLGGGLWQLHGTVRRAEAQVMRKQDDLAYIVTHLSELQSATPLAADAGTPLLVLIDRTAHDAGLADKITSTDPEGENGLRVRLENVTFDTVVLWVSSLQAEHGLTVQSASIARTPTAGAVIATFVLTRG